MANRRPRRPILQPSPAQATAERESRFDALSVKPAGRRRSNSGRYWAAPIYLTNTVGLAELPSALQMRGHHRQAVDGLEQTRCRLVRAIEPKMMTIA